MRNMEGGVSGVEDLHFKLVSLVGSGEAATIIEHVIYDFSETMALLERSVQSSDEKTTRFSANALVGMSSTFGFSKVEGLSRTLLGADQNQVHDLEPLRNAICTITSQLHFTLRAEAQINHVLK